jgi:hypothetical protein
VEDRAMDADIDTALAIVRAGELWALLGEPVC